MATEMMNLFSIIRMPIGIRKGPHIIDDIPNFSSSIKNGRKNSIKGRQD